MKYIQEITLDIFSNGYVTINAKQYDDRARFVRVRLTANGMEFRPEEGVAAKFRALKPDGNSVFNDAVIEEGGTILVELTRQALACPGVTRADVSLQKGTGVISTLSFFVQVEPVPQGNGLDSKDELKALVDATAAANEATEAAKKTEADMKTAETARAKAEEGRVKADTAREKRTDAAAKLLEGMTVSATKVPAGGSPTASLTKQGDHYNLGLGLVTGDTGAVASVNGGTGDVIIGCVNLLRNTNTFVGWEQQFESFPSEVLEDGVVLCSASGLSTNKYIGLKRIEDRLLYEDYKGKTIVLSFDIKSDDWSMVEEGTNTGFSGVAVQIGLSSGSSNGAYKLIRLNDGKFFYNTNPENGKWIHMFTKPILLEDSLFSNDAQEIEGFPYIMFQFMLRRNGKVYWRNFKMEVGTVATDWSPAPEDYLGPLNIYDVPEMHRNIYRGKNLGDHVTEAQKAAIAAGTWDDLYVGDYWTIHGRDYRIGDMNYRYNCGDTAFSTNHLIIVPDKSLGNAQMNSADTTEGGYMNSEMRTKNLDDAKAIIKEAFGDLVLSHREILTNATKDGHPSSFAWTDSEADLMNEIMVYGCKIYSPMGNGTIVPANYTIDNGQLALFALNPRMIKTRYAYWLRDVVSSSQFAFVRAYGGAGCDFASVSSGVRPAFAIGVSTEGDEPIEGPQIMDFGGHMHTELNETGADAE